MVWEITRSGAYHDLHDFSAGPVLFGGLTFTDGFYPQGAVGVDSNGNLYGTTSDFGSAEGDMGIPLGTLWKIIPEDSQLVVSAPSAATAGTPFAVTVTGEDVDDSQVLSYRGLLHFSSSDPGATLPANQFMPQGGTGTFTVALSATGSQTVTVSDVYMPALTGASGPIAVASPGASHLVVGTPASSTAGGPVTISVAAKDAYGNTVPTYSGLVHFTSTDAQASLPPDQFFPAGGVGTFTAVLKTAGAQTISATDAYLPVLTGTSSAVAVSANGASHLIFGAPSSATAGASFGFTLTAKDAYGNTVPTYTGLVHFSSSDPGASLPPNQFFPPGGVASLTATLATSGSQTITVTDVYLPALTGTSSGIAVGSGAEVAQSRI
jgi:hypothetical protein